MNLKKTHQRLIDFYNSDDNYFEKLNSLGTGRYRFIPTLIPDKSARILDAGCGTGNLLRFLKTSGYQNLEGLDICKRFAEHALTDGIRIHETDILNFKPENDYDCIIAYDFLEHSISVGKILEKMKEMLTDNGTLIICGPNMLPVISGSGRPRNIPLFVSKIYSTKIRKKGTIRYHKPVLNHTTHKTTDLDAINDINPHDLRYLLETTGFRIMYLNTYFNPMQKYYGMKKTIVRVLSALPLIRYMGGTTLTVCGKQYNHRLARNISKAINKEL